MEKFEIDSQVMHYQDVGTGPVLVFGHSYLWDSEMWAPQIAEFSKNYRCIVPDLWAHGQSGNIPSTTSNLVDYAKDILALLDHLNVENFSIIGLSVGGMWGVELTKLVPSRVASLVLMDTFVGLEPEVTHAKYFGMLDMIDAAQTVSEPLLDTITPLFFARNVEQANPQLAEGFRARMREIKGEQAKQVSQMGRIIFGRRDAFEDIEKFALPCLIMVGAEDIPRPVLEANLMHDSICGSEMVVIPAAGHISNLEQPEFINQKLGEFLTKVYE